MAQFDFVIYGNSVSALVAALELGKKSRVCLINPNSNWGAHFSGIQIKNTTFDIGMNYFEFSSFHVKDYKISSYNPNKRNDSARFFHFVESFIENRLEFCKVKNILSCIDGVFGKDIYIANNLELLNRLDDQTTIKIKSDLIKILNSKEKELHASRKNTNENVFISNSYKDISIANHGKTLHDLVIEPFCLKVLNLSSKEIPALFHRNVWAPLYYPETILESFEKPNCLLESDFHYPIEGYFSKLFEILIFEIKKNSNISILFDKIERLEMKQDYKISLSCNELINTKKLVWCSDLVTLLNLYKSKFQIDTTEFSKASICLAFSLINRDSLKKEFSTLYISNSSTLIYRITNQDFSAQKDSKFQRLIFEINSDLLNQNGFFEEKDILNHINKFAINNDLLNENLTEDNTTIKFFKNAITKPTINNYEKQVQLFRVTKNVFDDIELLGPAYGFLASSLNDQIVQALHLANKYS